MKFGKEFRIHLEETLPEWRDKYLCYKPLKKLLKNIPTASDSFPALDLHQRRPIDPQDPNTAPPPPLPLPAPIGIDHSGRNVLPLADLQNWFIKILSEELDKFNDFYVDKEEEFVIRFQELKERIERGKERGAKDGVFTDGEFSNEMMDIRKDFVTIHGEMVLLKNYSSLNFAGLVKILKKYDKRTGGLLQIPFAQVALHQPFFTTEPLTRLVRECEANLELLFPLEAEVIEAPTTVQEQMIPTSSATATGNISPNTSLSLGEEAADIYRSTVAAIKTIQGLRKASSTYNPLSFTSLFGNQDNDSTGAVTAENTSSDSIASLNGDEPNQDDVHSRE